MCDIIGGMSCCCFCKGSHSLLSKPSRPGLMIKATPLNQPSSPHKNSNCGYIISFVCCSHNLYFLFTAVLLNEFFPKFTAKIITVTPLIGVVLTTLLCASPVSLLTVWIYISFYLANPFILLLQNYREVESAISFFHLSDWTSCRCLEKHKEHNNISWTSCLAFQTSV